MSQNLVNHYLNLVMACLCDYVYPDPDEMQIRTEQDKWFGRYHPRKAHAMTGMARLHNVVKLSQRIFDAGVPGDFMECGVWRGGASILMKACLVAADCRNRNLWVADSFEGLPEPNLEKWPKDRFKIKIWEDPKLSVSLSEVQENFKKYGLLDSSVKFLEGWFEDTIPSAPVEQLALLRLDGDMYGSTWVCLEHLYPKLAVGGYIIIDDYYALRQATQATDDYRKKHKIETGLTSCEENAPDGKGWGVFWRKEDDV